MTHTANTPIDSQEASMTTVLDATEKTETVTFMARSENQILTRKKTRHVYDTNGERKVMTEDEWLADQETSNEKRRQNGEDPLDYDDAPWKIQFDGNRYTATHPTIIAWLRSHRCLNFNGPSGFWEMVEPIDPADLEPTVDDQLQALQDALMTHDPDAAEAVLTVEQETHNRPQVLKAAESAVASLRELIAAASGAGPEGTPPSTSSS